jgi:hypothetical protein
MTTSKAGMTSPRKVRAALIEQFWGNAKMGDARVSEDVAKKYSFMQLQQARYDSWKHGLETGFKAGVKYERKRAK